MNLSLKQSPLLTIY